MPDVTGERYIFEEFPVLSQLGWCSVKGMQWPYANGDEVLQ
jgi:hypothetical protein